MQTLSRLNRPHLGEETTAVLDFVNDAELAAVVRAWSALPEDVRQRIFAVVARSGASE